MKAKKIVAGVGLGMTLMIGMWMFGHGGKDGEVVSGSLARTTTQSITRVVDTGVMTTPAPSTYEAPKNAAVPKALKRTGMQVSQLAAGDFSSVEGSWANSSGHVLTFSKHGVISENEEVSGLVESEDGTAKGNYLLMPIGGGVIEFVPAGLSLKDYTYEKDGEVVVLSDVSDARVDRFCIGQDVTMIGSVDNFYYRVE